MKHAARKRKQSIHYSTTARLWHTAFFISTMCLLGVTYTYFMSPLSIKEAQEQAYKNQQRMTISIAEVIEQTSTALQKAAPSLKTQATTISSLKVEIQPNSRNNIITSISTEKSATGNTAISLPASEIQKEAPLPPKVAASSSAIPPIKQSFDDLSGSLSLPTSPTHPTINIIVTNLGLNDKATEYALRLPSEVALGFVPHTHNLDTWIAKATMGYHDILITLPAQIGNISLNSSAPYTLSTVLDANRNIEQLKRTIARTKQKIGLYTPNTYPLVSTNAIQDMLATLKQEELLWVHNNIKSKETADKLGVPNITPDVRIIKASSKKKLQQALAKLEIIARRKGHATAMIYPEPHLLKTIQQWTTTLKDKDITLTSLSTRKQQLALNNVQ